MRGDHEPRRIRLDLEDELTAWENRILRERERTYMHARQEDRRCCVAAIAVFVACVIVLGLAMWTVMAVISRFF